MRARDIKRMWIQILQLKSGINNISDERMQQIYDDYLKSWHLVPYIRITKEEADLALGKVVQDTAQHHVHKETEEKSSCKGITNLKQDESDVSDDSINESLSLLRERLLKRKQEQSMSIDLTISEKSKQTFQKTKNRIKAQRTAHFTNSTKKRGRLFITKDHAEPQQRQKSTQSCMETIATPPSKKSKSKNNAVKVFNSYVEFLPPNNFLLSPQINESVKLAHMQPVALNLTCTPNNISVSNDTQMTKNDVQGVDLTIQKTKPEPDYPPIALLSPIQADSNIFDSNYFNISLESPDNRLNDISLDEGFLRVLGIDDELTSEPTIDVNSKGLEQDILANNNVELTSFLDGDGLGNIFDDTIHSSSNSTNNALNEQIQSEIIEKSHQELNSETSNERDTKIKTSVGLDTLSDLTLSMDNTPLEIEAALMDPLMYDDDDDDVISVATSWDLQDDEYIESKASTELSEVKQKTSETQRSMSTVFKPGINGIKHFKIPKKKISNKSGVNSNFSDSSTAIDFSRQSAAKLVSQQKISPSNLQDKPKILPSFFEADEMSQRNQQSKAQVTQTQSAPTVSRYRPQQTELPPIFAPPYRLPIVPDTKPTLYFDNDPIIKYSTQEMFGVRCFRFLDGNCNIVNCNHNLNSLGVVQSSLCKLDSLSLRSAYKNVVRSCVLFQKYFQLFANIYGNRRMMTHLVQMISDCRLYKKYSAPFLEPIHGALNQSGVSNNEACNMFMKILWMPNCAVKYPHMTTELLRILAAGNWYEYKDNLLELFDKYRFPIPKDFMITIVNDVVQKNDPVLTEAAWELVLFNPISKNDDTFISVLRILSDQRNTLQQQVLPSFSPHLSGFRPMGHHIETSAHMISNSMRTGPVDPELVIYDNSKLHFPM